MFKRVGVLALILCGAAAFVHPTAAFAQDYRDWNGYGLGYHDGRHGRNDRYRDRYREREWREEARREERRERAWRAHEWRERQRWDNDWYAVPYSPAPRGYYGYPY